MFLQVSFKKSIYFFYFKIFNFLSDDKNGVLITPISNESEKQSAVAPWGSDGAWYVYYFIFSSIFKNTCYFHRCTYLKPGEYNISSISPGLKPSVYNIVVSFFFFF